jgi:hypothetical protein
VFGKIVRTVFDESDRISLLRNTPFAHLPNVFDSLKPAFAATKDAGLSLPQIVTEIESPVVQVQPIAIFL